MIFKTLVFLFVLYLLIKGISRFFLPSKGNKQSNARFFYQAFRNIQQQQKNNQQQSGKGEQNNFEEIEEADFEEIEEDDSKAPDS